MPVINHQFCAVSYINRSMQVSVSFIQIQIKTNFISRYDNEYILQNPHKRHPIAHPLGWALGCLLWTQILICFLLQLLQWCIQYHAILDRIIMALECIYSNIFFPFGWELITYSISLIRDGWYKKQIHIRVSPKCFLMSKSRVKETLNQCKWVASGRNSIQILALSKQT